jgi:uncharacterized protein involved in outer membrane biogenesis
LNATLLTLGIAIVLAFIAALVAPLVVDWSSQRHIFEAQLARVIGQPVAIHGDIEASFLPEPRFAFSEVSVGSRFDGEPALTLDTIRLGLAPGALFSGRAQITSAEIDGLEARFVIDETGGLDGPALLSTLRLDPEIIAADTVEIRNGRVSLFDMRSGETLVADEVSGIAAARALNGPFRFDGRFLHDESRYLLSIATGRREPEGMRMNVELAPIGRPLALAADGLLSTDADGGPLFEGTLKVAYGHQGAEDTPVEESRLGVDSKLLLDLERLLVDEMTVVFGPADRQVKLEGAAEMAFAAGQPASLALSAPRVDLDRVLGGGPERPVAPAEALGRLAALARLPGSGLQRGVTVDVRANAVVLGGEVVENLHLLAGKRGEAVELRALEAVLPGGARVRLAGDLENVEGQPALLGSAAVEAERIGPALRWLSSGRVGTGAGLAQATAGLSLQLVGGIRAGRVEADRFSGSLGGAPFDGAFTYRAPREGEAGALALTLDASALDLSGFDAPSAGAPGELAQVTDLLEDHTLDLALDIGGARFGPDQVESIQADLQASEEGVEIRRLVARGAFGADFELAGAIAAPGDGVQGRIEGRLRVEDASQVARLLARLGLEGEAAAGFVRRLSALTPLDLAVTIAGDEEMGSALELRLDGRAGETALTLNAASEGEEIDLASNPLRLRLQARNPDAAALMRQIGLPPMADPAGFGEAALDVTLRGTPQEQMRVEAVLEALGGAARLSGAVASLAEEGRRVDLQARIEAPDAADVARFLGAAAPELAGRTVALQGRLEGGADALALEGWQGHVGEVAARADGTLTLGPEAHLTGRVSLDALSLPGILSAAYAGFEPGENGVLWSGDPIAPLPAATLPIDLELSVGRLALGDLPVIEDARTNLSLGRGRLALDGLAGEMADGRIGGRLSLAPEDGGYRLELQAALENARLAALLAPFDQPPKATGRMDLALDLIGQGRTPFAIASTLSGEGALALRDAVIRRLDPDAFARTLEAADAGLELTTDAVRDTFTDLLDSGAFLVEAVKVPFEVNDGVVRLARTVIDGRRADLQVSGAIDVPQGRLDASLLVTPDESIVEDSGPATVDIRYQGPLRAPVRSVDVGALTNSLTVRRIEAEVERVEALQAEVLERERLARELVRQRQEAARREREAEREAERESEREAARQARENAPERPPSVPAPPPEAPPVPQAGNGPQARRTPEPPVPAAAPSRDSASTSLDLRLPEISQEWTGRIPDGVAERPLGPPLDIRPPGLAPAR